MNAAKILTVAAVCLGLGISGTHGVALCFGSDGSLSIEAALDGACAGARTSRCSEQGPLSEQTASALRGVDGGSSCHDVVIGQDRANAPLPSAASVKRLIERPGNTEGPVPAQIPIEDLSATHPSGGECEATSGQRPPPIRTTVLRL